MLTLLRDLRPLRPEPGQPVFPNLDGGRIRNATFWGIWTRCLQHCRIRHRGIYALEDTFVTHTLAMADESGEVERLTAWLVRQTGVRLDRLKRHYERWWPREREAIEATYALLGCGQQGRVTVGVRTPGVRPQRDGDHRGEGAVIRAACSGRCRPLPLSFVIDSEACPT